MNGVTLPPRRFGDLSCLGRRQHDTYGKTSQVLHQSVLGFTRHHGNDSLFPLSNSMHSSVFVKRATLRVGHSPLGCKDHKANVTITRVWLQVNKIGDRGAVALTDAVQALLFTVFLGSSAQSFGFSTVYTEDTCFAACSLRGRRRDKPV